MTTAAAAGASTSAGGLAVRMEGVVHLYHQRSVDIVALSGVDLDVAAGEMVALLGPSGMGKSTVMRLIAGLMRPSAGVIRVGGHEMSKLSAAERRALRATDIGYLVQGTDLNLLMHATALQNIWFAQHGARARGRRPPLEPPELLELLGLAALAGEQIVDLPRGQQQLVALVAAAASVPGLLLADEPTSQLDLEAGVEVLRLLRRINGEFGTTVVLVTHDRSVTTSFPRTVTIRDGRVGSEGRHGEEYAVVDGSGSVQLPPDILAILPPTTRVRVVRGPDGVELRIVRDQP
jgi:putative ABC transport system ATP-binding protein